MCRISTLIKAVLLLCALFCLAAAQGGAQPSGFTEQAVQQSQQSPIASVRIGNLTWTKQNINIKTADSWCYENNESNCAKYGRLYTWEAAKKACRSMGGGWRLPTRDDWDRLVNAAGGEPVAGKKLKSRNGWYKNGNGTDDYGFSALPSGYRISDGSFSYFGYDGHWWSATESGGGDADFRYMLYSSDGVDELSYNKEYGFAVRCSQD